MSSRIKQVRQVNYAEVELVESDEGSECTLYGSESGFESEVKLETERDSRLERSDWVAPYSRSNFSKEVPQLHKTVETEMTQPSNMEKLMEMMIQMRVEDRKDAQLREQRRDEEEERRRVREDKRDREERQREIERSEREVRKERQDKDRELQREERQAELLAQLKEAQPVVPQQITIQKEELPRMKDKDDLELFITQLEAALVASEIPKNKWKRYIHSQLTLEAKQKVIGLLQDATSTYDDIRAALLGCTAMTFGAAAEAFFSADRGKLTQISLRQAADKLTRWASKMTQEAEEKQEIIECMTVGALRAMMVPELKTYVDMSKQMELQPFLRITEEWERFQAQQKPIFKQQTTPTYNVMGKTGQMSNTGIKKSVNCFYCGKHGHVSCECKARLASEGSQKQTDPITAPVVNTVAPQAERKPIVCFACHQLGHKSPQCPKRQQGNVKHIQIPVDCVKALGENELMAQISGISVPITVDSGAQLTVVPEEMVKESEFTGENKRFNDVMQGPHVGKLANIVIQIGGRDYPRKAVAVPGSDISWTAAMSVGLTNKEEMSSLLHQLERTSKLPEEETHFLPPCMEEGVLQGAVRVSQGIVVKARDTPQPVTLALQPHCEEAPVNTVQAEVEVSEAEVDSEESLVAEQTNASVLEEAEGVIQGGSQNTGDEVDICVKDIVGDEPRNKLAEAILADTTLATARALGDSTSEGYHWVEQLLFRTRFDSLGDNIEQLCLPQPYRARCFRLAHENFGHAGRNKMCLQIRKYFYWPSMNSDVSTHCKSCVICQKRDKQLPKQMIMRPREVVTVPSERVEIDIVGPFPVVKGGFTYLLTYLNMATRWPEAIPLRKTKTKIVIDQLTLIFSRNGFPATLISNNGPQFVSNTFEKFLKSKGIAHVKASPYHPQGNGVIERMHRTLNNIIAKCTDTKGNWAQVVPMALYFLRCMPNRSTGLSPFALKHGWEPTTPLQLLYKGWVQKDLGPIDLEQWVMENSDRVQRMRDTAVVTMNETTEQRKREWDRKAQTRQFDKGDKVYLRKSGTNTKLSDSWAGPYTVEKRNSPLSYRVNTGDRILQSVHVQLLKLYIPRPPEAVVKRVTTVLEPDSSTDTTEQQYAEATVTGKVVTETREADISSWEKDFADILTKEPGLTTLAQF